MLQFSLKGCNQVEKMGDRILIEPPPPPPALDTDNKSLRELKKELLLKEKALEKKEKLLESQLQKVSEKDAELAREKAYAEDLRKRIDHESRERASQTSERERELRIKEQELRAKESLLAARESSLGKEHSKATKSLVAEKSTAVTKLQKAIEEQERSYRMRLEELQKNILQIKDKQTILLSQIREKDIIINELQKSLSGKGKLPGDAAVLEQQKARVDAKEQELTSKESLLAQREKELAGEQLLLDQAKRSHGQELDSKRLELVNLSDQKLKAVLDAKNKEIADLKVDLLKKKAALDLTEKETIENAKARAREFDLLRKQYREKELRVEHDARNKIDTLIKQKDMAILSLTKDQRSKEKDLLTRANRLEEELISAKKKVAKTDVSEKEKDVLIGDLRKQLRQANVSAGERPALQEKTKQLRDQQVALEQKDRHITQREKEIQEALKTLEKKGATSELARVLAREQKVRERETWLEIKQQEIEKNIQLLDQKTRQFEKVRGSKGQLEKTLENVQRFNQQLNEKLKAAQADIAERDAEIKELRQSLIATKESKAKQEQLSQKIKLAEEKEFQLKQIRAEIEVKAKELDKEKTELVRMRKALESTQRSTPFFDKEKRRFEKELDKLTAERIKSQNELNRLIGKRKEVELEIEEKDFHLRTLRKQVDSTKKVIDAREEEFCRREDLIVRKEEGLNIKEASLLQRGKDVDFKEQGIEAKGLDLEKRESSFAEREEETAKAAKRVSVLEQQLKNNLATIEEVAREFSALIKDKEFKIKAKGTKTALEKDITELTAKKEHLQDELKTLMGEQYDEEDSVVDLANKFIDLQGIIRQKTAEIQKLEESFAEFKRQLEADHNDALVRISKKEKDLDSLITQKQAEIGTQQKMLAQKEKELSSREKLLKQKYLEKEKQLVGKAKSESIRHIRKERALIKKERALNATKKAVQKTVAQVKRSVRIQQPLKAVVDEKKEPEKSSARIIKINFKDLLHQCKSFIASQRYGDASSLLAQIKKEIKNAKLTAAEQRAIDLELMDIDTEIKLASLTS